MRQLELLPSDQPPDPGHDRARPGPVMDSCRGGAWGARDRCLTHGGAQILDGGLCIEGGAVPSERERERIDAWFASLLADGGRAP